MAPAPVRSESLDAACAWAVRTCAWQKAARQPGRPGRPVTSGVARSSQGGAYAIEFALVFVVLFLVLYAILTYGFIFMAQQSLNRAANTGARTLLAWRGAGDLNARVQAANAQIDAFSNAGWIRQMAAMGSGSGAVQTSICLQGQPSPQDPLQVCGGYDPAAPAGGAAAPGASAGMAGAWVVVRYAYAQAPLIPILGEGFMHLPVPAALEAQAQVDLGVSYPGQPEAQ